MKILAYISLVLSVMLMSCPQNHKSDNNAEVIKEVLEAPDSILCYQIAPVELGAGIQPIEGYARQSQLAALSSEQEAILRFILLDNPDNYMMNEDVIVMSPFMPYIEFAFMKGNKTVSVLISTSDMSWVIAYGGKQQELYNYVDPSVVERFCLSFYDNSQSE